MYIYTYKHMSFRCVRYAASAGRERKTTDPIQITITDLIQITITDPIQITITDLIQTNHNSSIIT